MAKKEIIKKSKLTPAEMQEKIVCLKNRKKRFRVFYGFAKLTPKMVRKKELAIFYENDLAYGNDKFVNQKIHVAYIRFQTWEEMTDFDMSNRLFTKYGYFIDEKPWNSDIEKVLDNNYKAEENHISKKERTLIWEILRKEYYVFYRVPTRSIGQ